MTAYAGKNATFKVGGVEVGNRISWEIATSFSPIASTYQGDDWEGHIPGEGQKSWNGSASLDYDPSNAGQAALVLGASVAGTFFPADDVAGRTYQQGTFSITGRTVSTDTQGAVKLAITFQGNGALTEGTV